MKAILRSYFYRLFRDKLFYISLSIVFGLGFLISGAIRLIMANTGSGDSATFASAILLGLNGGEYMGGSGVPWMELLFFTAFGAARYRKETVSGAMRNYIVSGYSRGQIYHALYVGNLVYYLLLLAGILVGSCLPFIGTPFGVPSDQIGSFFGLCGLSLLSSISLMTFVYFTFVLLQGHGFAGSLGILIHVFLSMVSLILSLVVSINIDTIDKGVAKALVILNGLLVTGNRSAISGGFSGGNVKFDTIPGFNVLGIASANPGQGHAQEVLQEIMSVPWANFNISTTIILAAIIGGGFYALGYWINAKRDLK